MSRKEFLSLQSKVGHILAAITIPQPQQSEIDGPQSLAERVERLEARECLAAERISLKVEMGIWALDNNRTADHKKFLSIAKTLIQEVTSIKEEIKSTLDRQAAHSQNLVQETHNAYESALAVLQTTINGLRCSLTANSSIEEILRLTKEIYNLLFNTKVPSNV